VKIKFPFKAVEHFLKKYVKDYKIMQDGEIAINSPFLKDTTYDCRINIEKQCFHDFESDESGNIVELVQTITGLDQEESQKILMEGAPYNEDLDYTPPPKKELVKGIKEIEMPYSFSFSPNVTDVYYKRKAITFLKNKLIDYCLAKKYKLRWTKISFFGKDNFSHRILIPTYENDKLVYFQARDYLGKTNLRYKNPNKVVQERWYILPFVDTLEEGAPLFISEGPWEAIKYSGTYMLGPVVTEAQANKIRMLKPKSIYIIPDNDDTARRKLAKNIDILKTFIECPIYIIRWWDEYDEIKDPIDAEIEDITGFPIEKATRNLEIKLKLGEL
jgi:hypothetical protein